jgi:DNA-binding ferritin-like protein
MTDAIDSIVEAVKNQVENRQTGCLSMAAERQLVEEVERLLQLLQRARPLIELARDIGDEDDADLADRLLPQMPV